VKLILVEDSADYAESMRMLLELRGYEVRCYLSAHEFLQQADSLSDDDILITDYYLPDLNGIELVKRARERCPRVKAILLTGSREDSIVSAAQQVPRCRVEFKPLDYESLEQSIRQL
jgi:two-component system phosphoglycerate transport system response regulator PgtA